MSAITVPDHVHVRTPREHAWRNKAKRVGQSCMKQVRKALSPHKASMARLADIPLTVGGIGCIAAGVFIASTVAGFIILGVALIALNQLVGDD